MGRPVVVYLVFSFLHMRDFHFSECGKTTATKCLAGHLGAKLVTMFSMDDSAKIMQRWPLPVRATYAVDLRF